MNNTRFATVIHILTLLADSKEQWVSSEWLAGSININPVIVRKELVFMHAQGWVITKKGKDGGAALAVSANKISLADVYDAVKNVDVLGKKNNNPNPKCPIGKNINKQLDGVFEIAHTAVVQSLEHQTLEDFTGKFR